MQTAHSHLNISEKDYNIVINLLIKTLNEFNIDK